MITQTHLYIHTHMEPALCCETITLMLGDAVCSISGKGRGGGAYTHTHEQAETYSVWEGPSVPCNYASSFLGGLGLSTNWSHRVVVRVCDAVFVCMWMERWGVNYMW